MIYGLRKITQNWWYLADTLIPYESLEWAMNGDELSNYNVGGRGPTCGMVWILSISYIFVSLIAVHL